MQLSGLARFTNKEHMLKRSIRVKIISETTQLRFLPGKEPGQPRSSVEMQLAWQTT